MLQVIFWAFLILAIAVIVLVMVGYLSERQVTELDSDAGQGQASSAWTSLWLNFKSGLKPLRNGFKIKRTKRVKTEAEEVSLNQLLDGAEVDELGSAYLNSDEVTEALHRAKDLTVNIKDGIRDNLKDSSLVSGTMVGSLHRNKDS